MIFKEKYNKITSVPTTKVLIAWLVQAWSLESNEIRFHQFQLAYVSLCKTKLGDKLMNVIRNYYCLNEHPLFRFIVKHKTNFLTFCNLGPSGKQTKRQSSSIDKGFWVKFEKDGGNLQKGVWEIWEMNKTKKRNGHWKAIKERKWWRNSKMLGLG